MSLTPEPTEPMSMEELMDYLYELPIKDRTSRSPQEKLALCHAVLEALVRMPNESIWMDSRDDSAQLMISLAGLALQKI
jgi:hypothetical protein